MALTSLHSRNILTTSLLLVVIASLFLDPASALAMGLGEASLPSLADFSKSVQNGDANAVRGVYVPNVMALRVVQQPQSNAAYVSPHDSEATQFRMAAQYGTVGLLAHNYLSGIHFSQLKAGQEVHLVYGDGRVETFVVVEVLRYQALQPTSPYSSFRNLEKDETLTAEQMFKRVYTGERHVTFQTCIESGGNLVWGRLFVVAEPKPVTSTGHAGRERNK